MGSFNDWTRGTYLAEKNNRRIVDVTLHLFAGAAYLYRLQILRLYGFDVPVGWSSYTPQVPLEA
jgi:trans-AT polyketide synthase/acyltransferase/oxidoreductase domain-containing protein